MTVSARVEAIGPPEAEEIMRGNVNNFRNINRMKRSQYDTDMKAGNWHLNGETIKIAEDGTVLDGQHRLAAVISSGCIINVLVVRGITSDASMIDRGQPRSVAQWLRHQGVKNSNNIAAISRLIVCYRLGIWHREGLVHEELTDLAVIRFVNENQERLQKCNAFAARTQGVITTSVVSALFFVATEGRETPEDSELAVWFRDRLATGTDMTSTDPVYHLRARMQAQTERSRLSPHYKRAYLTHAWNKTVCGETLLKMPLSLTGPNKQAFPAKIFNASEYEGVGE